MRVLFLIPHPTEGASSRYRVLQYIPHFEAQGVHCEVSSFLTPEFYKIAYQPGHTLRKTGHFLSSASRRLRDVLRSRRFDLVFIHLGAFPIGPPFVEFLLHAQNIPMVFDLDDALFLSNNHASHALVKWLRMPGKIDSIIRWSRHVITCNDYLRRYAQNLNNRVTVIPTSLDTGRFKPLEVRPQCSKPLIGWIGSHSTFRYLEVLKPVLARLAREQAFAFKVVGASQPFNVPGVDVIQEPWSLEKDVDFFQELDIGVYPLPDERWVLGKTGFKTIQYMSVGVPCVVSDVGRNREIVSDGTNGFLARTEDAWFGKLKTLLTDLKIRKRFAIEGIKTVESRFSMRAQIPIYLDILRAVSGCTEKPETPKGTLQNDARENPRPARKKQVIEEVV